MIGTGGSGGLVNGVNGNQVGVADPGLGPLADNGGPTQTIALLSDSPAIEKVSNALAAVDPSNGQPLSTDQRGPGSREFRGARVDIGAFEFTLHPDTDADPDAPDDHRRTGCLDLLKRNKKGKPVGKPVVSFVFQFSAAMDPATAGDANNYQVDWTSTKKVKKKTLTFPPPDQFLGDIRRIE